MSGAYTLSHLPLTTPIRDYADLHSALRARADELGMTHEALDAVTGLADRYAGKLLAPVPRKHFGHLSLALMLEALGAAIVLVEDPHAMQRHCQHYLTRLRPKAPRTRSEAAA